MASLRLTSFSVIGKSGPVFSTMIEAAADAKKQDEMTFPVLSCSKMNEPA